MFETVVVVLWCLARFGAALTKITADPYPNQLDNIGTTFSLNGFSHPLHRHLIIRPHQHRYRRQELDANGRGIITDNHSYYNSSFYSLDNGASLFWFELQEEGGDLIEEIHVSDLSTTFRQYEVHPLPFSFRYYGHTIERVSISTGGFIYTGDAFNSVISATQIIAPLKADFNPSINLAARILVHSSTKRFTVQWDNVLHQSHQQAGPFTFQVSLFPNGTIYFAYKKIPILVSMIDDRLVRVEVGLSDGYYIDEWLLDRTISRLVHARGIYEHSRISLSRSDNLTGSAYVLHPLPNCITAQTCEQCVALTNTTDFECEWCEQLQRCSDTFDRQLQEWVEHGCFTTATQECPTPTVSSLTSIPSPITTTNLPVVSSIGVGAIVGISVAVGVVVGVLVVVAIVMAVLVYGYKHPTTRVGMYMIEHRPGARSLNSHTDDVSYSTNNKDNGAIQFED